MAPAHGGADRALRASGGAPRVLAAQALPPAAGSGHVSRRPQGSMGGGGMAVKGMALDDVRVIQIPWRRILLGIGFALGFVAAGFLVTNTYATLWQQRLEERWGALVTAGVAVEPRVGEPVAKLVI